MNLSEWLISSRGRQAALAKHLGLKPPQVAQWLSGKKRVPIARMAEIEAFTGGDVTRKEMRPDDWHLIWPELANEQKDGVAA